MCTKIKGFMLSLVLALDTSFQGLSLALYDTEQQKLIAEYQSDVLRDQARLLHPELQNMLQKHSLKVDDIQAIMVTKGPGSFTGVRLSLAVAKALSLAKNIPVYSLSTLEAVAFYAKSKIDQDFWVLLEVGRDKVFTQKFSSDAQALTEIETDYLTDFSQKISADDLIIGQSALKLYGQAPESAVSLVLEEESLRLPVAAHFVPSFTETLSQDVEPLYIQPLTYRKTYDKTGKPLESFKG